MRPFQSGDKVINPFEVVLEGYSRYHPAFNIDLLNAVTDCWWHSTTKNSRHGEPWNPRVFTVEEAIVGVPNIPYVEAVPRNTSPGYPYILENKGKGKT